MVSIFLGEDVKEESGVSRLAAISYIIRKRFFNGFELWFSDINGN